MDEVGIKQAEVSLVSLENEIIYTTACYKQLHFLTREQTIFTPGGTPEGLR